jgi:predicted membrane-bound mannosyltransferase
MFTIVAEVFGANGDALDLGLVAMIVTATVTISGWLWRRRLHDDRVSAGFNLRLALIEQRLGLDGKKSGVYSVSEGE